MNFPYADRFKHYLQHERLLEPQTITDVCRDINDLFNYLRNFNSIYQNNPDLSQLEETDIRDYLNMLQVKRQIKNTTYNKVLTHLNVYFSFLFSQKLSASIPTLALKGLKRTKNELIPLDWQSELPMLLNNEQLSYYTRLTLLLLAHYYSISEFLQPGFYEILADENFSENEKQFLIDFSAYISPIQQKQHTKDLFLKQRLNLAEPTLTLPGLHKYLKADQPRCFLPLTPRKLYQAAIFNFLLTNQSLSDQEICEILRIDGTSLNYYRQEMLRYELL